MYLPPPSYRVHILTPFAAVEEGAAIKGEGRRKTKKKNDDDHHGKEDEEDKEDR